LPQRSEEFTDASINGPAMIGRVAAICNAMEKEEYKLVNITPMIEGIGVGRYAELKNKTIENNNEHYGGGWGYGHGFSYTSGVMLLFHK
jgi:hypothetical protein